MNNKSISTNQNFSLDQFLVNSQEEEKFQVEKRFFRERYIALID